MMIASGVNAQEVTIAANKAVIPIINLDG